MSSTFSSKRTVTTVRLLIRTRSTRRCPATGQRLHGARGCGAWPTRRSAPSTPSSVLRPGATGAPQPLQGFSVRPPACAGQLAVEPRHPWPCLTFRRRPARDRPPTRMTRARLVRRARACFRCGKRPTARHNAHSVRRGHISDRPHLRIDVRICRRLAGAGHTYMTASSTSAPARERIQHRARRFRGLGLGGQPRKQAGPRCGCRRRPRSA